MSKLPSEKTSVSVCLSLAKAKLLMRIVLQARRLRTAELQVSHQYISIVRVRRGRNHRTGRMQHTRLHCQPTRVTREHGA